MENDEEEKKPKQSYWISYDIFFFETTSSISTGGDYY